MSKPAPRPARHLLVFAVSLVVLVAALAAFLFGVKMEDTAPGKGVVTSSHIVELRAPAAGRLVLSQSDSVAPTGTVLMSGSVGDVVPDGAAFAAVVTDGSGADRRLIHAGMKNSKNTEHAGRVWRVFELSARPDQRVAEGEVVAKLVEVDPSDPEKIRDPQVRLDIEEKYFGEVVPGREVRLYSNMYHHRVHGVAKGKVERLEPAGEAGANGGRVFHAWVAVTESPFPLKLGSSVRAEIVIGRKPTYQIILEH